MWVCVKCGKENENQAAFCDNCGAPQPAEPGKATAGKRRKVPLLIGGIVLGLALIGLGLWLLLGKGGPNGPLFRIMYFKSVDRDGVVTETRYSYNGDYGHAGHYRNGQYTGDELLRLNGRGLIESSEYYNSDGALVSSSEFEYDRAGNRTLQLHYDAEGSLTQRVEIEYDDYRVATRSRTINYQNGQETTRAEFEMSDRIHGEVRTYQNGELISVSTIERIYEGNSLVGQNTYSLDGHLGSEQSFVRDEYYNAEHWEIEYVGGSTQSSDSVYERIG